MAKNFPAEAIQWVRRAKWTGPQNVPWNRVDTDDEKSWAASKQPKKVNEFKKLIQEHEGHVAPSILVQHANDNRAFIVDGHHRALARRGLKQDVVGYVGNIDPKDRMAARKPTVSSITAAAIRIISRRRVSEKTPELSVTHAPIGHEGVWHSKKPPLQLPAYIQNIRNALMRSGHGEQEAHALAVAAVKRWAKGDLKWGKKRHVTPEVQQHLDGPFKNGKNFGGIIHEEDEEEIPEKE